MPTFNQDFISLLAVTIAGVILLLRKVKEVLKEVKPNGGKSLADSIKRIEDNIIWMNIFKNIYEHPLFMTDSRGNFIWVNNAYMRLVGANLEELSDKKWLSIVIDKDRNKVREEWKSSIEDKRAFDLVYNIQNGTSNKFYKVREIAYPNISSGDLKGYLGTLSILEEKS